MKFPRLGHPVVLVHGLAGYGRLNVGGSTFMSYWTNIPEAIAAAGNRVFIPRLPATASVARRAAALKAFLDREAPGQRVHLIAHSMGGLDSRHLISRLGMAERVLSLTTLGTPHRGCPFADWGVRRLGRFLTPLLDFAGLPYQAFHDLTVARCRDFNRDTPDAPGVRYFSVAGRFARTWLAPEWQLPARIVERAEGDNDGIVSVASASYGESCEVWDGDHINLVNWHHPWAPPDKQTDRVRHYAALVGRLADEGF